MAVTSAGIAAAIAIAAAAVCPFIVHMNLQLSKLWGGPSARVQLICWDSMHSIVSLACYSCIQMTQMPRTRTRSRPRPRDDVSFCFDLAGSRWISCISNAVTGNQIRSLTLPAPGWDFTSTLMATNCRGAQNCGHVSLIWCCHCYCDCACACVGQLLLLLANNLSI